jgi:hypothetical protein
MISIMVFMSVVMFGQDLRKIAKETIMEKLSEWSLPTNENYHKLKALGINADSLTYVKINVSLYCPSPSSYPIEKFIDSQKDTVIVKHYKVLGKEKADTVNAVVCTGTKYDFPYFLIRKATFSISYHYIETYVIFDYQNNVIGIAMKVYEYVSRYFNEETRTDYITLDLVSTIREIPGGEKFCEILNKRHVERKQISTYIPYYHLGKGHAESKDNKKKTKRSDNRVDDVY